MSLLEAATNVVVGYVLAIATQIVVFPWFGIDVYLSEHMAIGLAFVAVSLARSYLLRRLFEAVTPHACKLPMQIDPIRYTRVPPEPNQTVRRG